MTTAPVLGFRAFLTLLTHTSKTPKSRSPRRLSVAMTALDVPAVLRN